MPKKHTIGNVTAGLMIGTALLIDGAQFLLTLSVVLLPVSEFLAVAAAVMFFLWFLILGAYTGKKSWQRMMTTGLAAVIELVPVIGALPAVTGGVVGVIVQTRITDARTAMGKKATPRTVESLARLRRMQASQQKREQLRKEREAREGQEHPQAGDTKEGGEE
jgi:hypothetical protein